MIRLDRVVPEKVDSALSRLGLRKPRGLAERCRVLEEHYRKTSPARGLADCTTCGGVSDLREAECPFCGDSEVEGVGKIEQEVVAAVLEAAPPPPRETDIVHVAADGTEVLVEPPPRAETTDLDVAVERFRMFRDRAATAIWEMATAVRDLYRTSLWKLRRDESGAAKWGSWAEFVKGELGISHTYSYRLIDVATAFTAEQVREFGVSRLSIVLKAPPDERSRLIDEARSGASALDMARHVDAVRGDAATDSRYAPTPPRPDLSSVGVTAAMLVARVVLPLVASDGGRPARRIGDVPTAEERLLNGVKQTFTVDVDSAGRWVLIVERMRE